MNFFVVARFFFLSIFAWLCYNSENQHSESDFFNLTASNNLYLKYIFLKKQRRWKKKIFFHFGFVIRNQYF